MKTICIYHTRTGLSEQIAEQIADSTGAELLAVSDGKSYKGFFGYIAAAVVGLKKSLPAILPYKPDSKIEEYDKVIVVAPIWCENVSPIMRAFLVQNKNRFKGELYYVITSMSAVSYQSRIDELGELAGRACTASLRIKTHKNDWHDEIENFVQSVIEAQ